MKIKAYQPNRILSILFFVVSLSLVVFKTSDAEEIIDTANVNEV